MPIASAAVKAASVAAPVAQRAAQKAAGSDWTPIIIGLGLLLVFTKIGKVTDLLQKPAEILRDAVDDVVEGTGDFFEGVIGGAEREETDYGSASLYAAENQGRYDPNAPTSVTADIIHGELVLTTVNPNPAVPLASYSLYGEEPSLAQKAGAAVGIRSFADAMFIDPLIDIRDVGAALIYDPLHDLYFDPALSVGGNVIIPSVQSFTETPIIGFRQYGIGPTLGDVGSYIGGLFD